MFAVGLCFEIATVLSKSEKLIKIYEKNFLAFASGGGVVIAAFPGAAEDVVYGHPGLAHGLAHQPGLEAAHHSQRTVPGKPLRPGPPLRHARYTTQDRVQHY